MDSQSVSLFVKAFQERMSSFIPRFEELYQKGQLINEGKHSKVYNYFNKISGLYYAVKEISIKDVKELDKITNMIDIFALIDSHICNKNHILCCEGFYYKFNRKNTPHQISNPSHKSLQSLVTIDFFLILEKCDGSLEDLFQDRQFRSITFPGNSHENNKSTRMSLEVPRAHLNNNVLSQPPLFLNGQMEKQIQEIEELNRLFCNLKNLILQVHELDGSSMKVESFHSDHILYKRVEGKIEFKFAKIARIPTPQTQESEVRQIAHVVLSGTFGQRYIYPIEEINNHNITKEKDEVHKSTLTEANASFPPKQKKTLNQTSKTLIMPGNTNIFSSCDTSHKNNKNEDSLIEVVKQVRQKFEDIEQAQVNKICRLLEKMIKGATINQCFYEILKLYNCREIFYQFNQTNLTSFSQLPQSLSTRKQSFAQPLLFSLQQNIPRLSDFHRSRNHSRNQYEDNTISTTSPSNARKRSTFFGFNLEQQTQMNGESQNLIISQLKDQNLLTLVQNFQNLVAAVKQKKKKIRFEKYLSEKELKFLKTIDPNFCPITFICIDFSNFYQEEAMKLAGECFKNLVNLQGLELNFDLYDF